MSKHTATCREEFGHCTMQKHRENPRRAYVYPSPYKNGLWRASIVDVKGTTRFFIGHDVTETYAGALELAAKHGAAA